MGREKELKTRSDGMVNVSLDADAVKLLDEMIEPLEEEFGFRPSRSQGLRCLLKRAAVATKGTL